MGVKRSSVSETANYEESVIMQIIHDNIVIL